MASYTELINGAITSFNSVWNALKTKDGLLTDGQKNGSTLVPTANYGGLVKKLVIIDGVDGTNINKVDSVLSGNSAINLKTNGIAVESEKFVLSAVVPKNAYYSTDATLKLTVDAQDISFSPNLEGVINDKKVYSYATSDSLIKGFSVAEGSVSTTFDKTNGLTNTLTNHVSSGVKALGGVAADKVVLVTTDSTEDHYIDIDISAITKGKITATAVTEISEGYVVEPEDEADKITTIDKTYGDDSTITDTKTIRVGIKKGSVEISSSDSENTVASITSADNTIWATEADAASKKIEISSSVSGLELNGTFTEGYVTAGSKIEVGDIIIPSGKKYIKKGSLGNQTVEITDAQITATPSITNLISDTDTGITITVTEKDTLSQAVDFETGFIGTSGATINTSLSKTINIKKASGVSAVAKLTNITAAGAVVSEAATGRAITLTPSLDISNKSLTSGGYIGAASEISFTEDSTSLKEKTIYINEGSVEVSQPSFNVTLNEHGTAADGTGGTQTEIGEIFVASAAGLTGDYFTVVSTTTVTKTEGYIDAGTATPTVTRYMPKAVIEKVTDGDEEYLQVKKAGYLPSGTIAEVSAVSPSVATVNLSLSGIETVNAENKETDVQYHKITISKSGVSAGYISDSKGALTGNELYVKKGTITATPSATYVPGTVSRSEAGENVTYSFPITASLVSGVSLTSGYFATADIPTTLNTAVTSNTSYTVDRAVLNTSVHTTEVTTTGTVLAATGTSSYVITPSISKCSASFSVNKAGYLSSADDATLKFDFDKGHGISNLEASKFYIKAGTGVVANSVANVSNSGVTVSNINKDTGKITQTSSGAYTLSVGGAVNANISIDEGYYGTAEKTLQGVVVSVSKDITVAHGSVTAGFDGSNSNVITSSGVALFTEDETKEATSDRNFVSISADAVVNTSTTVTEGYIKESDKTEAAQATYSATKYIELYKNTSTDTYEGESVYKVSVGQTTATLPSAAPSDNTFSLIENGQKYSEKDTKIVLTDNAMGKSVIAELLALERRLNGQDLPVA